MARRKKIVKLSKKQIKYQKKITDLGTRSRPADDNVEQVFRPLPNKDINIPKIISIRQLSEITHVPTAKLILALAKNGIQSSLNQSIDFETAALLIDEWGFTARPEKERVQLDRESVSGELDDRPPVVAIMGHVDHGKTTLLDTIRKTNIADSETGGITQHIGAYQADGITFLDTPGHEAFSILRSHGALITDITVLVVAADEGVKPQTLEAISHAKAANVPIIVAINKVDSAQANSDRVRQQLAEQGLKSDQWGGNVPFVEVSAKTGKNIDDLLATIHLVAELQTLKAQYDGSATGVVIESAIDHGIGSTATVLVSQGTLKLGDRVVFQNCWGKIRSIKDWQGKSLNLATPSQPVTLTGLKGLPKLGETFRTVEPGGTLKQITENFHRLQTPHHLTRSAKIGIGQTINVIVKADSTGSLESIRHCLQGSQSHDRQFAIIYGGIGPITESDINLAKLTKSWLVAFRTKLQPGLDHLLSQTPININHYNLIYDLLKDTQEKLTADDDHSQTEVKNEAQVLKIFREDANEALVGVKIIKGVIKEGQKIVVLRNQNQVGYGSILSIRQVRAKTHQATTGMEVGLIIKKMTDSLPWQIESRDTISSGGTK